VNKRYCNMCIDVPESTTVKCGPGDCCTFVCITIRQVCVYVRACFSEDSRYCLSLLTKDLVLMISISLCTAAQEWTIHLRNLCRLADAAVTSESMVNLLKWTSRTYACSNLVWCTAFMVMMSTNCLICLPMRKKDAVFFLVSPLMEWFAVIIYYLGIFVWAIFVWRVVSQRLVELKVFSRDIQVVILLDVSIHEVRLKGLFDLRVLAMDCVHVGCPFWIDDTTKFMFLRINLVAHLNGKPSEDAR